MRIATRTEKHVPLEKPAEFARALSNSQFQTSVSVITTSAELANLIRTLNGKNRPFAVATVEGK